MDVRSATAGTVVVVAGSGLGMCPTTTTAYRMYIRPDIGIAVSGAGVAVIDMVGEHAGITGVCTGVDAEANLISMR